MPSTVVILRPFIRPCRPFHSWSTTFCLRAWLAAKSIVGLVGLHAELLGAGDRAEHRGRLEELLGRDAAAVQARAADLVLLDHGDRQAGGGAVEGGRVAARAAADDDDVELLGHGISLPA